MTRVYRDHFGALTAQQRRGADAPSWLAARREQAMARFEALGFPTTKNEDWHYTSLTRLADAAFEPMAPASGVVTAADVVDYSFGASWPTVVFVNGRFSSTLSALQGVPDGVRVLRLASAVLEEPTLLERYLTRIASIEDHALTALNTAFLHDGVVLHVSAGANATVPVHVLHVTDSAGAGGVTHARHAHRLEPNALQRCGAVRRAGRYGVLHQRGH